MITTTYKVEVDIPKSIWDIVHFSNNQALEDTFESMFRTAVIGTIGSGYGWYDGDCTLWAESDNLEEAQKIENRFKKLIVNLKERIRKSK